MAVRLTEGAIDALFTYLQANMAAKVAELNLRYMEMTPFVIVVGGAVVYAKPTVHLEDIKLWYLGNLPFNEPEVPSICLQGENILAERGDMANSYLDVKNHLRLIVMVGDADPDARFRKLARYVVGLLELLREGRATYGYAYSLSGDIALSDTLPSFLQGIEIPLELSTMEAY